MKFNRCVISIVFLLFLNNLYGQVDDKPEHLASDSLKINRIEISKNWMTWDRIIKNELLFKEGDWTTYGALDTSITKVWNIGNFADVKHEIVPEEDGNVLKIQAMDAVQFYPVITVDYSSENDYNYRFGFGDENFLGSNCLFKIVRDQKPTGVAWDFSLKFPRQLLYKNMTARVGFNTGTETKRFLERTIFESDGVKKAEYNALMLAPYNKTEVYLEIGNPWHLDYQYRFSPNLSLRYMKHIINPEILSPEELELGVNVNNGTYNFLDIQLSENIGIINKKRHRLDGYLATASYDLGLGLAGTKSYHAFNLAGEYHKTLNDLIQLSFWAKTGYTTASNQYQFIKGSKEVLGLRTGELYGQVFYAAYAGTHFTWLNTKWVSLENAYFVNWGNGASNYASLFSSGTKLAVGTFLEMKMPVVSFIAVRLTFMYAGPGTEWFKFNM